MDRMIRQSIALPHLTVPVRVRRRHRPRLFVSQTEYRRAWAGTRVGGTGVVHSCNKNSARSSRSLWRLIKRIWEFQLAGGSPSTHSEYTTGCSALEKRFGALIPGNCCLMCWKFSMARSSCFQLLESRPTRAAHCTESSKTILNTLCEPPWQGLSSASEHRTPSD